MPVAQGSQTSARQAVLVALGGLGALVAIVFLVTRAGSLGNGGTEIPIQLGEPVFTPGPVEDLAAVIDSDGPLLLPDASNGDRDLIVNHLSESPDDGWVVFSARELTAPRDCFVEWQPDEEVFVDSCSDARYPPDGEGLQGYGTSIEDGNLVIDLNVTLDGDGDSDSDRAGDGASGG